MRDHAEARAAMTDILQSSAPRELGDWLQTHRVELNAMTMPPFIEWPDAKMAASRRKFSRRHWPSGIEERVRAAVTECILREAGFENQCRAGIRS
jgi:hypothetical protein